MNLFKLLNSEKTSCCLAQLAESQEKLALPCTEIINLGISERKLQSSGTEIDLSLEFQETCNHHPHTQPVTHMKWIKTHKTHARKKNPKTSKLQNPEP
jgi:hypothetical protein